jgi:hypothetical protein
MTPAAFATPLLDREQPIVPAGRRGRLVSVLIGVVVGLLALFGPALASPEDLVLWFLGFLAALFGGVVLHELGHLAAGTLAGFDFYQIVAGPWVLAKESSGYKLRFLPRRILTIAGFTQMIPRTTENLRRGFAIFAAGGPAATALLFLPVLLLPWGPVACCWLLANLVMAVFSWIPMTIAGSHTDGKILRTLTGSSASSESFAAILYVMAIDRGGVEPHAWPSDIVNQLEAEAAGNREFRAEAAILLAIRALDIGDTAVIAAALERVLRNDRRLRPEQRRIFYAEAAVFQGVFRRNAVLALDWLTDARKIRSSVAFKDWDAAAQAALAMAEENWGTARSQLARAIARLDQMPGRHGSIVATRRRLVALRDALPAPLSSAAVMAAPNPDK